MPTSVEDFRASIEAMIREDLISTESSVYLLSRDGETLRVVKSINVRQPAGYIRCGTRTRLSAMSYLVEGTLLEQETKTVGDLLFFAEYAEHTADKLGFAAGNVRLLADGFGYAHWTDLEAIKLATEIKTLRSLELTETSLVLCT